MLFGPSDMYGDMSLEDVEEFEGLQPDDGREVDPSSRFQRNEIRNFDQDFEYDMDRYDDALLEDDDEYFDEDDGDGEWIEDDEWDEDEVREME